MADTEFGFVGWPRLSEELTGPRHRHRCQSCGLPVGYPTVARYRECDNADKPEPITVVLCTACAKRLVGPHKRLYIEVFENDPLPGAMALCTDCRHLDRTAGLRCGNPQAKQNGGEGIHITAPKPVQALVDGTRDGKRWGGPMNLYLTAPKACSGRSL